MAKLNFEKLNFSEYDNPERARRIWNQYYPDLKRLGIHTEGVNILDNCNEADGLDVRLDMLLTKTKPRLGGTSGPVDIDSDGSWGNAVDTAENRIRED